MHKRSENRLYFEVAVVSPIFIEGVFCMSVRLSDGREIPIEMHKVRIIQKANLIPSGQRLAAMEEAGRVRRGYFVEGLGGSQFALPGALDRLRAGEAPGVVTLAAADPANLSVQIFLELKKKNGLWYKKRSMFMLHTEWMG